MTRRSTFRPIRGWALLVAAAALAACQTQGADTAGAPPGSGAASASGTRAALVPPAAATTGPDSPKPDELVGMAAEQVAGRIGRPDHVWREPPAAVWQYAEGGCVLHVFLYPADGTMRVRHVELRRGEPAAAGCYAGLIADRKMTPAAG